MTKDEKPEPCPECNGDKRVPFTKEEIPPAGEVQGTMLCPACNGTGERPADWPGEPGS